MEANIFSATFFLKRYIFLIDGTDICQPVDAGYGQLMKQKIRQVSDQWLENDDNLDIWMGNSDDKLTVSKRRILITQWVGEAHRALQHENYDKFRWSCFERTGCLLTADGSDDDKVKPEGLHDYKPIPPLETPGPDYNTVFQEVESVEPPNDHFEHDTDENIEDDEDMALDLEDEDHETDRLHNVPLVGKKICVLYEEVGWHTGIVKYYNTKLDKYLLEFEDDTTDLIKEKEIDGKEIFIVDETKQRSKRVNYAALAKGN